MQYVIVREDTLAHHGIKGQKWGVRRYENADGTLTEAGKKRYNKSLDREYKKGERKLAKLEKRADINLQAKNAEKYKRQAKILGKAALATGALAGASVFDASQTVPHLLTKKLGELSTKQNSFIKFKNQYLDSAAGAKEHAESAMELAKQYAEKAAERTKLANESWATYNEAQRKMAHLRLFEGTPTREGVAYEYQKGLAEGAELAAKSHEGLASQISDSAAHMREKAESYKRSATEFTESANRYDQMAKSVDKEKTYAMEKSGNAVNALNTATYVLGGATVVLGAAAGVRAIQSSVARKRTKTLGHEAAVKKYEAHVTDMLKTFGGTKYETILKQRVEAYKKEHPGTQMTNAQIAESLS